MVITYDNLTNTDSTKTPCISFRWVAGTLALRETHHGSRALHTNQIINFQPLTWITFKALPRKIKLKGSAIVRTRWDPKKIQIVSTKEVIFIRPEMSYHISNELFQQNSFTGKFAESLAARHGNWKPSWNSESSSRCADRHLQFEKWKEKRLPLNKRPRNTRIQKQQAQLELFARLKLKLFASIRLVAVAAWAQSATFSLACTTIRRRSSCLDCWRCCQIFLARFAKMKPSWIMITMLRRCHRSACPRRAAVMCLSKCLWVRGWLMYDSETFPTCLCRIDTVHVHEAHVGANMGFMHMHCLHLQVTKTNWIQLIHLQQDVRIDSNHFNLFEPVPCVDFSLNDLWCMKNLCPSPYAATNSRWNTPFPKHLFLEHTSSALCYE